MQSGWQLSISNSEADKLVMLPWVTVLTRAKLAQGGEACDINVVVDDSVRLLDNDDAGVWARKTVEEMTALVDTDTMASSASIPAPRQPSSTMPSITLVSGPACFSQARHPPVSATCRS